MLFPISHERMKTRRWPVVTIAIVVFTLLVHGVVMFVTPAAERAVVTKVVEADLLRREQPSLGICPPLAPFVGTDFADLEAATERLKDMQARLEGRSTREATEAEHEAKRARYETLCSELGDALEALPAQRFGFVPAKKNVLGLVTAVFLHGSVWHVLGNMWFLFLCGLALEDRWGRAPFVGFYLVAGVLATASHWLAHAGSTTPVIGASGAVAGAMGAFLVLFATTRIRFALMLGRPIFFGAPAYVMLPLWVAVETLFGLLGKETGTAHWAHVGGFVFGVAVAFVLKLAGVDRRLDDAVERVAVLGDDPRIDTARALIAKGDAAAALAMLQGLAKEKPDSHHVWQAFYDAANAAHDAAAIQEATARLDALARARALREATDDDADPYDLPASPPPAPESAPPRSFRVAPRAGSTSSTGTLAAPKVSRPSAPEPDHAPFFPPPPRK